MEFKVFLETDFKIIKILNSMNHVEKFANIESALDYIENNVEVLQAEEVYVYLILLM